MSLSSESLKRALRHPFQYYDRVESSSDIAKTWLLQGAPELACVIADEQLRGRGRGSKKWHNPPQSALALSVLLRPPPEYASRITLLGAVSVYDLAAQIGCPSLGIKWPNDVQAHGKKLSGVLTESIWQGDRLVGLVLGIGVNVRVDFRGSPLQGLAISLEDAVGRRLDRTELLRLLLEHIERWYRQIGSAHLHSYWRARLNMLNKRVSTAELAGIAVDVSADGALLLRDDAGRMHEVQAPDIRIHAADGIAR